MDNNTMAKELCTIMKATNKRLFIIIVLLIVSFTGYILYDKWDDAQWQYETTTVDSEGNGIAVYSEEGDVDINGNGYETDEKTETIGGEECSSEESDNSEQQQSKEKDKNQIDSPNE